MKISFKKIVLFSVLALIAIIFTFSRVKRVNLISWNIHSKVNEPMFSDQAINGYDPVSYFTKQRAEKGNKEYLFWWNKATWYFASKENEELFKSHPQKYAPQFGGYCVFAVSKGFTANSDPEVFTIMNGKLYLCADKKMLEKWQKEGEVGLSDANQNWK